MSYKRTGTLIHNWSHSFISLMNYVDDDYIFHEIARLLSRGDIEEIILDALNGTIAPERARTPRLVKSLRHSSNWLLRDMRSVNVQPHELALFKLVVSRPHGSQGPLKFTAVAKDDRGKDYRVNVVPFH